MRPTGSRREDLASIAALRAADQTLISVNQIRNIQAIVEGATAAFLTVMASSIPCVRGHALTIARKYSSDAGMEDPAGGQCTQSEIITVGQQLFIPDTTSATATRLPTVHPSNSEAYRRLGDRALRPAVVNPATGMTEQLSVS